MKRPVTRNTAYVSYEKNIHTKLFFLLHLPINFELRRILRKCLQERTEYVLELSQYTVNSTHSKCWKNSFCEICGKKWKRQQEQGGGAVVSIPRNVFFFLRLIFNVDFDSAACYSCMGTEEECGPTVSRDDVNDANKRVSIETCDNLQTHACWVRHFSLSHMIGSSSLHGNGTGAVIGNGTESDGYLCCAEMFALVWDKGRN